MSVQGENEETLAGFETWTKGADLTEGTRIHRYQILQLIGKGGMGAVYQAYDPELDRSIAIKILTVAPDESETASRPQARLMREAQALAKLNHPNVVAVHDVGTYEEGVYIAMEYVKGKTLREWLTQAHPSQQEIIQVLTKAGMGIQAAHREGIVHRDFKPDNVLVGDKGEVRVLDFGLARAAGIPESALTDQESLSMEDSTSRETLLSAPLTRVGATIGTTVYMAPEHFLYQTLDEKTDQFSFCVTLFEALYGKRPFTGKTIAALRDNVTSGGICIPSGAAVPAWIRDIILKGLSVSKSNRFPTLTDLLAALQNDPTELATVRRHTRQRRLLLISLFVLMFLLPIGVWYGLRYRTVQLCKAAEGEFDGVWEAETKHAVQQAFIKTTKPYAQNTWERVQKTIDHYQSQWLQMRGQVCEARHIRGTESEELFDLRMSCLKSRKQELSALTKIFAVADVRVLEKAVQASSSLTAIDACANEQALHAPYAPPKTAEAKTRVADLRQKLTEVEAQAKTGRYREGLALVKSLQQEVKEIGYAPIQAEVGYWLGELLEITGDYNKAKSVLYAAARTAAESKNALLAAKAMALLAWVVGFHQNQHQAGLSIAKDAEIMLGFAGFDNLIQARILNTLGVLLWRRGDYASALAYYRKVLAIDEEQLGPEHTKVAQSLNNIGIVLKTQGEYDKALKYYRRVVAIFEKALGAEHPNIAVSLNNIAEVYLLQGEYTNAIQQFRKAMAIWEKSLEPEHPHFGSALSGIGMADVSQGSLQMAIAPLERAVRICDLTTCDRQCHGRGLLNLAQVLVAENKERQRAIKLARRAQRIYRQNPTSFKKEIDQTNAWLKANDKTSSLAIFNTKNQRPKK